MSFLARLTPPPIEQPLEYDGWELRWRFFVFRPALFKTEVQLLLGLLVYLALAFYGKWTNSRKANAWFQAHLPLLNQQFSKPTIGSLTQDGSSDFFNFSTGRRNVTSLHSIFALRPRHDLFQWLFQTFRTFVDLHYRPVDSLQLDFKLQTGTLAYDFVWGLVKKDEFLTVRDDRWDLTLVKISENPILLPSTLSVMSEFADVTESLFKLNNDLLKVLKDPENLTYFRSLSITDQPRERPSAPVPPNEREKHLILTLTAPPLSRAAATIPLVAAMFPLIDSLNKINLRPETKSKLKKTREDIDKQLKEEAEREKKEELSQAKEDQRAAKRKADQERIARMSAVEQQKILEKEKKRSLRKAQGKQLVKK